MLNVHVSRTGAIALFGLGLACASANETEAPARVGACSARVAADGSVHVSDEALGVALDLPRGFAVACAEGEFSADFEQASVGLVNVVVLVIPGGDDPHAALLEQFRARDGESFGVMPDAIETVAAGAGGRELRCYGGPTRDEFGPGHYYACTGIELRGDGTSLASVARVLASSDEWRINGDASVQMIQSLSRAWTLTPAPPDEVAPSRTEPLGCAERLGVDPQALAQACGLGPLVAQTEQQTFCELRFATSAGQPDALVTLREFRHRDADAAWSVHRASFGDTPGETFAELPGMLGSHWSSYSGYRWAFVPGWTHARRLGWFEADCAPENMLPVLTAMLDAPQPRSEPAPRWRSSAPVQDSLASSYGARDDLDLAGLAERSLPYKAKKIIVTLLSAAAREDDVLVRRLLTRGAGFGAPDRREFDAWAIAEGDNFSTFMTALRSVASRLPADASFTCPPIQPEFMDAVTRGEHPMWCSYASADGLDLLAFRLLAVDGLAYVDYVGMFETAPTQSMPIPVPEASKPMEPLPPLTPGATEPPEPGRE